MTTSAVSPELVAALRRLRLGRIADTLPDRIALAQSQDMSVEDLFTLVLTDEIARRDGAAVENRVSAAKLPVDMTLEHFDKSAKIAFDKKLFAELCSLRFLRDHRHVVILGPVGVGKTFIASALGNLACRNRYDVRFIRADAMLSIFKKSRLDNSHEAEMAALCSVDLLVLDDFALEPMSREESKDIYQLFVERTGRASMVVTSNRDTAEWIRMFDDVLLAQSAIDRFMNAAYDLVIEGESYRPRLKPKLQADPVPDAPVPKKLGGRPRRRR
jgi:DNA replication protein DnaC